MVGTKNNDHKLGTVVSAQVMSRTDANGGGSRVKIELDRPKKRDRITFQVRNSLKNVRLALWDLESYLVMLDDMSVSRGSKPGVIERVGGSESHYYTWKKKVVHQNKGGDFAEKFYQTKVTNRFELFVINDNKLKYEIVRTETSAAHEAAAKMMDSNPSSNSLVLDSLTGSGSSGSDRSKKEVPTTKGNCIWELEDAGGEWTVVTLFVTGEISKFHYLESLENLDFCTKLCMSSGANNELARHMDEKFPYILRYLDTYHPPESHQ